MINLTIHGHFYQPPRENPWSGEIEMQKSASPYHDWNDRILHECYLPNSEAQIIDDTGKIVELVNNYEYLNFNFGPTLLNWIRHKYPNVYNKILEADKISVENHNGHGNAIAMCYGHTIMPLANEHDKITHIKWGLADFKYHFGRDSEGIWLPETACNQDTIEVLISEEIRYIILDVSQADKLKQPDSDNWIDVSSGNINPKIPYRCYSLLNPDKYISIIFYDGPISKAVAFDDVLVSSNNLMNKVKQAVIPEIENDELIGIATDGETFGHHKKFADRTLAYFIKHLVSQNGLYLCNFGEYLEKHPAIIEVKIKHGVDGEGTSWSCPHGVKRWKEDCGCGSDGVNNQKWRRPLRFALDWLRDELIDIFIMHGNKYFKNIWDARNGYINLVLEDTNERRAEFFYHNAGHILSEEEIKISLEIMEMQKYSMFMFTSCGWFFSEISGLEAVQILQYAARAIELAEKISGKQLEKPFLNILENAESNIAKYKNGKGIWRKLVAPAKAFKKLA